MTWVASVASTRHGKANSISRGGGVFGKGYAQELKRRGIGTEWVEAVDVFQEVDQTVSVEVDSRATRQRIGRLAGSEVMPPGRAVMPYGEGSDSSEGSFTVSIGVTIRGEDNRGTHCRGSAWLDLEIRREIDGRLDGVSCRPRHEREDFSERVRNLIPLVGRRLAHERGDPVHANG